MSDIEKSDPIFYDALFRQKKKHGKFRIIEAPAICGEVADTHAHLQMLEDPVLELARCAFHKVTFVCTMVDIHEDGDTTFDNLDRWIELASQIRFDEQGNLISGVDYRNKATNATVDCCQSATVSCCQSAAADCKQAAIGNRRQDATDMHDQDATDMHNQDATDMHNQDTTDTRNQDTTDMRNQGTAESSGHGSTEGESAVKTQRFATPSETTVKDAFPVVVRIATGCHPHHAQFYTEETERRLIERAADPRVAAVGEIGLDYHYDFSPREVQREVFVRQLRVAKQLGLPVVLHVREAHDDAFELLEQVGFPEAGTLLHCYNRDYEVLKPWIDRGCFAAFGGPLTFKQADDVREAALHMPLDKVLTETDAPFMTPEPMRGMPCGPSHVIFTADMMCRLHRGEPTALLEQMMRNARGLLDRAPTEQQRRQR